MGSEILDHLRRHMLDAINCKNITSWKLQFKMCSIDLMHSDIPAIVRVLKSPIFYDEVAEIVNNVIIDEINHLLNHSNNVDVPEEIWEFFLGSKLPTGTFEIKSHELLDVPEEMESLINSILLKMRLQ